VQHKLQINLGFYFFIYPQIKWNTGLPSAREYPGLNYLKGHLPMLEGALLTSLVYSKISSVVDSRFGSGSVYDSD